MLTIWSKIIQTLVNTDDVGAGKLAMALVDDKKDFYRWAVVANCKSFGLSGLNRRSGKPILEYASWCMSNCWMASYECETQLRRKMWKLYRRKPKTE